MNHILIVVLRHCVIINIFYILNVFRYGISDDVNQTQEDNTGVILHHEQYINSLAHA